jgi:putative acetyltransferase
MPQLDVAIHIQRIIIRLNKILDVRFWKRETDGEESKTMGESEQRIEQSRGEPVLAVLETEIRELVAGDDATAFRTLNEEWITRYFTLEEKDREVLGDPEAMILHKGGHIYMAYLQGEAVGCVALLLCGSGTYELSKMAVAPHLRGLGIGRRLLRYALAQARGLGAKRVFLGSSSKLKNAVHLYESMGFRHVPPEDLPPMSYARADVFMEKRL